MDMKTIRDLGVATGTVQHRYRFTTDTQGFAIRPGDTNLMLERVAESDDLHLVNDSTSTDEFALALLADGDIGAAGSFEIECDVSGGTGAGFILALADNEDPTSMNMVVCSQDGIALADMSSGATTVLSMGETAKPLINDMPFRVLWRMVGGVSSVYFNSTYIVSAPYAAIGSRLAIGVSAADIRLHALTVYSDALTVAGPVSDDPLTCSCFTVARDPTGAILAGASFEFDLLVPSPLNSDSVSTRSYRVKSASDGSVQVNLPRLAVFQYRWGIGEWQQFTVPDAPSYRLPKVTSGQ